MYRERIPNLLAKQQDSFQLSLNVSHAHQNHQILIADISETYGSIR